MIGSCWIQTEPPKKHLCDPPGFWERRSKKCKPGAIWRCYCQQRWYWGRDYVNMEGPNCWIKVPKEPV